MKNIILGIFAVIGAVAVIVALAGAYEFYFTDGGRLLPGAPIRGEIGCTMEARLCPDGSAVGRSGPSCEFAACPIVSATDENIRVTSPHPEDVIKNPLTVTGEAKGTWFFEASFPISLIGDNGMILGTGTAEAKGDWMTTDFVPFEATIRFSLPTTASGSLVLSRDNPSGLPENDAKVLIPIKF